MMDDYDIEQGESMINFAGEFFVQFYEIFSIRTVSEIEFVRNGIRLKM